MLKKSFLMRWAYVFLMLKILLIPHPRVRSQRFFQGSKQYAQRIPFFKHQLLFRVVRVYGVFEELLRFCSLVFLGFSVFGV